MASAPFSLNTSSPGNSDIASNFPTLDRSDKDVIQSWLLTQMNTYGHDNSTLIDGVGSSHGPVSAPTPSAGTIALYYDTDFSVKQYAGDLAQVEYVGVPPGSIIDYGGATAPAGYLLCYGQAVSRITYARLFTALGSTWGNGDGATTFNVPDLRGIACFGLDNMGGTAANRITVIAGTTLGTTGGTQQITIGQTNLPSVNFAVTITDPGHTHLVDYTFTSASGSFEIEGVNAGKASSGAQTSRSAITGISATAASGGSGTAISTLSNAAIVNKIIKF